MIQVLLLKNIWLIIIKKWSVQMIDYILWEYRSILIFKYALNCFVRGLNNKAKNDPIP